MHFSFNKILNSCICVQEEHIKKIIYIPKFINKQIVDNYGIYFNGYIHPHTYNENFYVIEIEKKIKNSQIYNIYYEIGE
jgi:hypothetical protein